MQRYTVERLRKEIEPVSAADFLRFLASWQFADEERRRFGPQGVAEVARRLAGVEAPAALWESRILKLRVKDYHPAWLDQVTLGARLLERTGVVFRRIVARDRMPVPWRDVVRALRRLELRGDVRGGRFVAGFDGEQYALADAVTLLRAVRRRGDHRPVEVAAG